MIRQDAAYLSAALAVGDARTEHELLAGYAYIQACCRIADGEPHVGVPLPLHLPAAPGTPEDSDGEDLGIRASIAAISDALSRSAGVTRPLVQAVAAYGEALFQGGLLPVALPVLELVQRLATRGDMPDELLGSAFRYYLLLIRGVRPGAATRDLAFTLAVQARRARDRGYVGAARYLEAERLMLTGNLPAAQRYAERLLPWAMKHGSVMVEGAAYNVLAAIHGRAGRFKESAQFASRAIAPHFPGLHRYSALVLLGSAFSDLGMPREARAAFEVAASGPYGVLRRVALAGLVDILAQAGDRRGFERLYRHLRKEALLQPGVRIAFLRDAARGWASFGELRLARANLRQAHALAREHSLGLEIIATEDDLGRLARAPRSAQRAIAHPDLSLAVSHVMTLRSEREACVAGALP